MPNCNTIGPKLTSSEKGRNLNSKKMPQVKSFNSKNQSKPLKNNGKANTHCNTGGYGFPTKQAVKNPSNVTKLDWLSLTNTNLGDFESTMSEIETSGGILEQANLTIIYSKKGFHGYQKSAKVFFRKNNESVLIANIGISKRGQNKGGLIQLTGVGCQFFQVKYPKLWGELNRIFSKFKWRVSRADIALDLPGDYCLKHGYTVPSLFRETVVNGLFKSDKMRNQSMKQTTRTEGDWAEFIVGKLTSKTYNPVKECPAGLTVYIGSRKNSADCFRMYEKGKQILGAEAEPNSIERAWIRIEHEMTRKGTGREIPLDVMISADEYFATGRSSLRALMDTYRESLNLDLAQEVHLKQFRSEKLLLLSSKIHWAKRSYGPLFRTLINRGIDNGWIISSLTGSEGLKEFIFDLE